MLATAIDQPFRAENWVFEIKFDGYRAIASKKGKEVSLTSRNLKTYTQYSQIEEALKEIPHEFIFDGEIVALDKEGKPSFQILQNYQKTLQGTLRYFVFDLLYLDGHNIASLPLLERKSILYELLPKDIEIFDYSDHIETEGEAFFKLARQNGLEGIVAKEKMSRYQQGVRSKNWLKIRVQKKQEALICGFTEPRGSRKKIGALVLGAYENDTLVYIGHTGTGMDDKMLELLYEKLKPLEQDSSPFTIIPQTNMPATWVEPKLICEIQFTEWTEEGHMRHPVFLGLREDKKPEEVIKEKEILLQNIPQEKPLTELFPRIHISNQSKLYFPDDNYTKGDILHYYHRIAEYILPYLKDRIQTLYRHPNGIYEESFYQKDVTEKVPSWIKTCKRYLEREKKEVTYLLCQDEETLLYLVNLGCIELNPWTSKLGTLDYPSYCALDLDPVEIGFDAVIEVARRCKEIFDLYKIPSFLKISGKRGLHIYIPLGEKYTYDQSKQFAELLATLVHNNLPDITSLERMPEKRQNKVYLDYLQNRKHQTMAAPYSVRPVPHACVSTPIDWNELTDDLKPERFTIMNVPQRLKEMGDVWKGMEKEAVDMEKVLKRMT